MAPSKFQIYVDQSMRQVAMAASFGAPAQPQQPNQMQDQQLQQQQQQYHHNQQQMQQAQPQASLNQPTITTTTVTTTTTETPWQQGGDQVASECNWPRYVKEDLVSKNQMFYFDERKIYPASGGENSFEELNLFSWMKRQSELNMRRRCEELEVENEVLKADLNEALKQRDAYAHALKLAQEQQQQQSREALEHKQQLEHHHQQQLEYHQQQQQEQEHLHALQLQQQQEQENLHVMQLQQQQQQQLALQQQPTQTLTSTMTLKPNHSPPNNRLSIIPQSLQPAHCNDADTSCYVGGLNEPTSVVKELLFEQTWRQKDKFTLPIDQSQYIREHCPTSTPTNKDDKAKKANMRRMSRPSMGGGSPTMKLSPITETSRDCNSKSSSSSSAMSTTPGTTCKRALQMEPVKIDEPDRPLDPNDPTTYRKLLRGLAEPLERRSGYIRVKESMPTIESGACFGVGGDRYLVDKEISKDASTYTAQLLDNSDDSNSELPTKLICFRVDQPSNDWLFYICDELHKRLVRLKTKPDIELSVMNADPAFIYTDGSLLVDEYFRCVPMEDYFSACLQAKKEFPKSVAAYLTLELIQLVRVIHSCDVVHMNLSPKNIIITGCPSREDITSVDERTSIVKLIGFDHSIDTRILPSDFKFDTKLDYLSVGRVLDSKPWSYAIDWVAVLDCIHRMFFLEDMNPVKDGDRWKVNKQFKGFPTDVWDSLFDGLLNINDIQTTNALIEKVVDELNTWIKANISFVLREAVRLDMVLENFCKSINKSI